MSSDPHPHCSHRLGSLRLAAALTHQLPPVALTVWAATGPALVVSRDARQHPDLSACELRSLVAAAVRGLRPPPELSWVLEAVDLTVEGIGVRHVGDGVVAAEHDAASGRWWPTLLGPDAVVTVLGEAAMSLLEDDTLAPSLIARAEASAHVDTELGVTVVQLRAPTGSVAEDRATDELARALSRACVVGELLRTQVTI
jgi:hypothetical protein